MNLKPIFMEPLLTIQEQNVAVLFSGGIDSLSILFGLLELGKSPIAYTFTLQDRESTDFRCAKTVCDFFGIPFNPVYLPTDLNTLKTDLLYLIQEQGNVKKTDIECMWATTYAIRSVKEKVIVSGLGADGHFGISKRAMIHFRHSIDLMDEFRESYRQKWTQEQTSIELCKSLNKVFIAPYNTTKMIEAFRGTSWEEINTPHQKQPILDMFPDFYKKVKIRKHLNFQKGDSGISDNFLQLIKSDWNIRNHKSPVGIYHDIQNGLIPQTF